MSRITLCWWNTSLSPSGKDRAIPSDATVFQRVIEHLIGSLGVDFCVLGEVSETDVESIRHFLKDSIYQVVSGVESLGRSSFSTCLLFNSSKLTCQLGSHEILMQEQSKYRIAQHAVLATRDLKTTFYIFISHWPSRLHLAANAPLRLTLGDRLRQRVDKVFEANASAQIILMGDYNDEPFDQSLSSALRATRDKDLAKKKSTLLYNPFWRHLCHPEIATNPSESQSHSESWGSYFHQGGTLFKWRTFDQMLFSSSFLGLGEWYLDETNTSIINFEPYTRLVMNRDVSFDHLPIIATLERNQNG